MSRVGSVIAAAFVAIALSAGCGGGDELSKDEYEEQVGRALQPARAGLGAIETGRLRNRTQAAAVLAGVSAPLARAADRIDRIDAPDEVQRAQDQFVAAIRDFAVDSFRAAQALEKSEVALRRRGGIVRPQTRQKLRAAAEAYRAEGYDVANAVSPAQ